jgi:hypothetical protein
VTYGWSSIDRGSNRHRSVWMITMEKSIICCAMADLSFIGFWI